MVKGVAKITAAFPHANGTLSVFADFPGGGEFFGLLRDQLMQNALLVPGEIRLYADTVAIGKGMCVYMYGKIFRKE